MCTTQSPKGKNEWGYSTPAYSKEQVHEHHINVLYFKTFHCSRTTLYSSVKIFEKDTQPLCWGTPVYFHFRGLLLPLLGDSVASSVSGKAPQFQLQAGWV